MTANANNTNNTNTMNAIFTISGVYVLALQDGKYYVGSSTNIARRLQAHEEGTGSAWTQKYKPVSILSIHPSTELELRLNEEETTYDTMAKFGISNVRGASFCNIDIAADELETIAKLLLHRQDKCIKCGKTGHFVNECPNTKLLGKQTGFWGWVQTGMKVLQEAPPKTTSHQCYRCGRSGHFSKSCYAKTHVNGRNL
jgi:predicted GIY-YIG superfamily endonuclease